jgi:hypothetical protein
VESATFGTYVADAEPEHTVTQAPISGLIQRVFTCQKAGILKKMSSFLSFFLFR